VLLALGMGFLPLGIREAFFEDTIKSVFTKLLTNKTEKMISSISNELKDFLHTGVERVFPSRRMGLEKFLKNYFVPDETERSDDKKQLVIVGSSLKGLIGKVVEPNCQLVPQNESQKDFCEKFEEALKIGWKVKILLTHTAFADLRSLAETRGPGEIREEIISNLRYLLIEYGDKVKSGQTEILLYQGSPTIFIIATPKAMLLNPYFYSSTAMENICMEIHPVELNIGISLHRAICESHIDRPWDSVCTTPIRCEEDLKYIKKQDEEEGKKNLHRFMDSEGYLRRDFQERLNIPSVRCQTNNEASVDCSKCPFSFSVARAVEPEESANNP
jgi:hypothetical protein